VPLASVGSDHSDNTTVAACKVDHATLEDTDGVALLDRRIEGSHHFSARRIAIRVHYTTNLMTPFTAKQELTLEIPIELGTDLDQAVDRLWPTIGQSLHRRSSRKTAGDGDRVRCMGLRGIFGRQGGGNSPLSPPRGSGVGRCDDIGSVKPEGDG
jgi:hypothetical protein